MSAPYRITRPSKRIGPRAADAQSAASGEEFKGYLDRLMKMIPAEVVGLYLVGNGFVPTADPNYGLVLSVWTLICLIGVIVVKAYGTADVPNHTPPDWVHVAISSVAFFIWVYSIGGPFTAFGLSVPYIGSLLVLAWTFFIPIVYRGPTDVPTRHLVNRKSAN